MGRFLQVFFEITAATKTPKVYEHSLLTLVYVAHRNARTGFWTSASATWLFSVGHYPWPQQWLVSRFVDTMPSSQTGLEKIATHLSHSPLFPSKIVVPLDAVVVNGLFQQRSKKKKHRTHAIQTIGISIDHNPELLEHIRRTFQSNKERLYFDNPDLYQKLVRNMAIEIYRCHPSIKLLGSPVQHALEWYAHCNTT